MAHRIGFIGTGEIARIHARAIQSLDSGSRIVAAYDVNPEAVEGFCRTFGGEPCLSAQHMMDTDVIDTVYICTRHDSHADLAQKACLARKRVFLEKPVAMDFTQALSLRSVYEEYPVPLAVGFNMRVAPATLRFKEVLSRCAVQPESFRASMTGAPFMGGWASDPALGGGVLVCQGSHMFDLLVNIIGSPVEAVCAYTQHLAHPKLMEPNAANLLIRLENGLCGTLLLHDRGCRTFHVEPGGHMVNLTLYSPQGTFELDAYGRIRYATGESYVEELPAVSRDICQSWGYQRQAREFDGLDLSTNLLCTLKDAVQTAAAVDAARLSAKDLGWIRVQEVRHDNE